MGRAMSGGLAVLLALLAPALSPAQSAPQYTISTIAGTGTDGYAGDAGAATSAQVNEPISLAVDASGLLYISDHLNNRIRKIAADGTITTIVGDGLSGYYGDAAAASLAEVYFPAGISFDASGNLYIADFSNHVIRKVATTGTISTIAGNNSAGYTTTDPTATDSTTFLAATSASLNYPMSAAVSSKGIVYIADTFNHLIRRITSDGYIYDYAGVHSAGVKGDGGAATSAYLNYPENIAFDAAGNLYVVDTYNHRIRKIDANGIITTVVGTDFGFSGDGGPAINASLAYPKSIAFDTAGNMYIADALNSRIRVVGTDGIIWSIAGNGYYGYTGDGGLATKARLRFPGGVAVDKSGNVYIADTANAVIRKLTPILATGNSVPPPAVNPAAVATSAAYGTAAAIAPATWIDIGGAHLAANTRAWTPADFVNNAAPTSLDGTKVTIGGKDAYVSAISPTLVSALLPADLAAGAQDLIVTTAGGTSKPVSVTVAGSQPALLAPPTLSVDGKQYAAALLPDGTTYALPAGAISGSDSRPAHTGETVVLYGAGFGPVTPLADSGQVPQQDTTLNLPLKIFFGNTEASIVYQGLATGSVGLYRFQVVVPNVNPGDAVPISFTLNGVAGTQKLYTAVQN